MQIRNSVLNQHPAYSQFIIRDDLLYFKNRLVIPSHGSLKQKLLAEFHSSVQGGHAGFHRTFHRLASNVYWKNMRKDIRIFVAQCLVCQQIKTSHLAPTGLLQPLPIPARIWEDISLDFIIGLPYSNGKTVILVVVDRLSKYAHFLPLVTHITSLRLLLYL